MSTAFVLLSACLLLLASAAPHHQNLSSFTLDDISYGFFYPSKFSGTWISGREITYVSDSGAVDILNVESGRTEEILPAKKAIQFGLNSYSLSPDRQFLLYSFDKETVFRRSSLARYSIIDLTNGRLYPLAPSAHGQPKLQYATWNTVGQDLFYVYQNNIYYRPVPSSSQEDIQVTFSGTQDNTILNGVTDWLYEEEILYRNNAIWCSKDGTRMVFATFNGTQVDEYRFPIYGEPGTLASQYPIIRSIRYPKPGRSNPTVSLWSVDVGTLISSPSPSFWRIPTPTELQRRDHYFSSVVWANDAEVSVTWLNRPQNTSYMNICNVVSHSCENTLVHRETRGWINLRAQPVFSEDGRRFIAISPVPQLKKGDFKHIVLYDRDRKERVPLTEGLFEVTQILAWNDSENIAYFTGTASGQPGTRHLYSVHTGFRASHRCLTCSLSERNGQSCTYNTVTMSTKGHYFLRECEGPGIPHSSILETTKLREVRSLKENEHLRSNLAEKVLPKIVNLQVPVGNGFLAQVRLYLPPLLNQQHGKLPLVLEVYGGPGYQTVDDKFVINFGTFMATSHNVVYAFVDGRGSGYQGNGFMHDIYKRLGTLEIDDYISVTKYITQTVPYIDKDRLAIWGHSYGGFASLSTLVRDKENLFKCAVAVAPVTSWIYYDSAYTERFMGFPTAEDNKAGYDASDLTRKADSFRHKKLLIIHGTADDNVHYQQSMMLIKALEDADVLFRQQSYPDEDHNIARFQKHMHHSVANFFMSDCFGRK